MIKFVGGDFFDYHADIRINTVNCVGVMGAGVALQFKDKYPKMYDEYVKACNSESIKIGHPQVWQDNSAFSNDRTIIINFPTKNHWKNPSKYEYIEEGLEWLKGFLKDKPGLTITVPALGCGHGGLDWAIVKGMISTYLQDIPMTIFYIYSQFHFLKSFD
jgi:O-acetyl-ADP-ribose deacetylase (regulator of RNase III)